MASSSAMNSQQSVGAYAPGSLAARPTRHAGGVRRRDESPEAFRARMDGLAFTHGQAPQGAPPMAAPPQQTRQDRILAARMDGTFASKRESFNSANAAKGLTMNEAGDIVPVTPGVTSPSLPASPVTASGVTPPVTAAPPTAPRTQAPVMQTNPGWSVTGQPSQVRAPATFDGQSKAAFFGSAMAKYGPTAGVAVYRDPAVQAVAAAGGKVAPPSPQLSPEETKRYTSLGQAIQIAQRPTPSAPTPATAAPKAAKPWKPIVQMASPGLSPGSQQFQDEMKALHRGQKLAKPPGVAAVIPKPGSTAPQPFSAAALGTRPVAARPQLLSFR